MKNIRIICDTRSVKKGGVSPIKISIPHKGRTILMPTGVDVLPCQFSDGKVINTSNRNQINAILRQRANAIDNALLAIEQTTPLHHLSPNELKQRIERIITPEDEKQAYVCYIVDAYIDKLTGGTRNNYKVFRTQIINYCNDRHIKYNTLTFTEINRKWLQDFESWLLERVARNTASRSLGHLRTIFNYAINEELITHYPFRGYRLKHERTKSRALSIEQLRTFLEADVFGVERKYRLIFELSLLLLGMNVADIWKASPPKNGRIEYRRSKTRNRYSVKVGKRAKAILAEIGHPEHLTIASLMTLPSFRNLINFALKRISNRLEDFPTVTSYYARHTWATIAANIGVPRHIIGAALGHTWTDVTGIYIGINEAQVDEASEAVEKYIYGE